jgi:hypothetical protein
VIWILELAEASLFCSALVNCTYSDRGQDSPDEPSGDRPTCAREETHAEPDADLVEVDF